MNIIICKITWLCQFLMTPEWHPILPVKDFSMHNHYHTNSLAHKGWGDPRKARDNIFFRRHRYINAHHLLPAPILPHKPYQSINTFPTPSPSTSTALSFSSQHLHLHRHPEIHHVTMMLVP
jgi:hypothetical protein